MNNVSRTFSLSSIARTKAGSHELSYLRQQPTNANVKNIHLHPFLEKQTGAPEFRY